MGRMLLPMGQLGERAYNLFQLRTQVVAGAPCDRTFVSASATTIGSSRLFLGWPERKLPFDFPSFFGAHFLRISFLSVNSIKNFKTHF